MGFKNDFFVLRIASRALSPTRFTASVNINFNGDSNKFEAVKSNSAYFIKRGRITKNIPSKHVKYFFSHSENAIRIDAM